MRVYKILTESEWADLDTRGESAGAPVDRADGFVHLSTADQVAETAGRHFAGLDGLVLAAFDAATLGPALRWEPSRGGALFPHLYGPLRRAEVAGVWPLPLGPDGTRRFPEGLA